MIKLFIFLLLITNSVAEVDYFIQVPDIHIDNSYTIGSNANCILGSTGMGCCRKSSLQKIPIRKANKWGDYNCDSPKLLVNHTLLAMRQFNPRWLFFVGDIVDHNIIFQSYDNNLKEVKYVTNIFHNLFNTSDYYAVLGNHDTFPIDQTIPIIYSNFVKDYFNYWNINTSELGYYQVYLADKLKLIALNSIIYDNINIFKIKSLKNDEQMKWLNKTLYDSSIKKETVWILNHIAMGDGESTSYYNNILGNILSNYSDIIKLNLYGHSHEDNFKLYKKDKKFFSSALISASIVPNNHDPCFRVYKYDTKTYTVLDYYQYCANLTKAMVYNVLKFEETYSFNNAYNTKNVSLESLIEFYNNLQKNKTLASEYCSRQYPIKHKKINSDCINDIVIEIE